MECNFIFQKEVSRLRSLAGGGEIQDNDTSVISFPGSPISSFKWEGAQAQGSFSPLTSAKRVSQVDICCVSEKSSSFITMFTDMLFFLLQKKDYEVALVGAFRREKDKERALQALREENEAAMKLVYVK